MKQFGDVGELQAIEYLKSKGYSILTTNYKFGRIGEVDIIASVKGITVFFEVKKRSSDSYGSGLESITFTKRKKIYKTILSFMGRYHINEENIRFDIISISGNTITHFEGMEL